MLHFSGKRGDGNILVAGQFACNILETNYCRRIWIYYEVTRSL